MMNGTQRNQLALSLVNSIGGVAGVSAGVLMLLLYKYMKAKAVKMRML